MKDNLGQRVKRYEAVSNYKLLPRSPLFIRVDGKAFHTWTKGMERPFSQVIIDSMVYATQMTAQHMSGFKLAYTQSDEATFMLTDYDTHETQGWFDYELNKVVSITASAFTAFFNREYIRQMGDIGKAPALFDARAFTVPHEDAPNMFIWRQRDWERNSVQMYARAYFSHKELEKKKIPEIHEMLHTKGLNWANLSPQLKNGTFVLQRGFINNDKQTYESLRSVLDGYQHEERTAE